MPDTTMRASTDELAKTIRLLLALWDLGGVGSEVKQGELTKRIVQKGQKKADYKKVLDELEADKAIVATKTTLSLSEKGLELLNYNLINSDFAFSSQVGAKTANALLRIMRTMGEAGSKSEKNGKAEEITSYDAFKVEAFKVFTELDKGYNYAGLVPIWHIRQVMGDSVKRTDFNDWIMQMQAEKAFYLQAGEAIGATEEQKQNSIESEIRGLLFYAGQPS